MRNALLAFVGGLLRTEVNEADGSTRVYEASITAEPYRPPEPEPVVGPEPRNRHERRRAEAMNRKHKGAKVRGRNEG